MTNETRGQSEVAAEETMLIRGEGSAYAVPVAVLEWHRIPQERREHMETALREGTAEGDAPAEAPLYELPPEALASYQLSTEERDALEAQFAGRQPGDDARGFGRYAPNQPKGEPINGYTGYAYSVTFGAFQMHRRGLFSGEMVYIGNFGMHQEDIPPGAQPGMGLR